MSNLQEVPKTPEGASPELAAIWLRALAFERGNRFQTAEEVRLALQLFLDHRGSNRLAEGAASSLGALERELSDTSEKRAASREAIYNLFGECTFGFRQALQDWPDNEAAQKGLRDATRRMIEYEIAQDDPRSARLLLARLEPTDEALEAEVAKLERHAARSALRVEALEQLGREMDPNAGRRGRASLLVVLGLLWVVVPLAVSRFYAATPDYASLYPVPVLMFVVVMIGGLAARRAMMRTALNRSLVGATALTFFAQIALHIGSSLAHVPPEESQRFILFIWFVVAAVMAVAVAQRLAFPAAAYLVAYLASSAWPGLRYELMAAANAVLFVTLLATFVGRKKEAR